jgi:superfamily II DNA or RNA helicase
MQTQVPQGRDQKKEQQKRLESLRARQVAKARQASEVEGKRAQGLRLRPYQLEAVEAACAPMPNIWCRIIQMATGGGKTLVIAAILDRLLLPGQSALVLAHRDELLSQAIAEIEGHLPGILVEREQAGNRATRMGETSASLFDGSGSDQRRVVVASVQSMQRNRLESFVPTEFSVVVVDEVHHAIAPSYRRIMEYFGCFDDAQRVPLIGVTATSERTDRVGLDNLFQAMSSSHGIRDLIEQGHLCTIRALSIRTETDLRGIKMTAGDFNVAQLEEKTNTAQRNARIIAAHKKYARDRPTLCFATGVDHATEISLWRLSSSAFASLTSLRAKSDWQRRSMRAGSLGTGSATTTSRSARTREPRITRCFAIRTTQQRLGASSRRPTKASGKTLGRDTQTQRKLSASPTRISVAGSGTRH